MLGSVCLVFLVAVFTLTAQPASAQSIPTEVINKNLDGMLERHNACRRSTGAGLKDVEWDESLANFARQYAETLLENNQFQHSSYESRIAVLGWAPNPVGENLGYTMDSRWEQTSASDTLEIALNQIIHAWCDEKQYYDYANNTCESGKMCGHYTQMVWQSTTHIGCGAARSGDGSKYMIVCHYGPAGNYIGERPY